MSPENIEQECLKLQTENTIIKQVLYDLLKIDIDKKYVNIEKQLNSTLKNLDEEEIIKKYYDNIEELLKYIIHKNHENYIKIFKKQKKALYMTKNQLMYQDINDIIPIFECLKRYLTKLCKCNNKIIIQNTNKVINTNWKKLIYKIILDISTNY